jgi:segregation and condensation protein B
MMNLETKIEAILFFKGEPVSLERLSSILKVPKEEVAKAVLDLERSLSERGIVLLQKGTEITLGTAPELSKLIENLQKEELNRELSKASLETLSIVLYRDVASRSEIDYIRGVNSSFTLRLLSVRGLVEKTPDPKDNRRYIYKPSFELLSFMGIKSIIELPDYQEVSESIKGAAKELTAEEQNQEKK